MARSKIRVEDVCDLSLKFGSHFFEFSTQSGKGFSRGLEKIILDLFNEEMKEGDVGSGYRRSKDQASIDSDRWRAKFAYVDQTKNEKPNFLSHPHSEIVLLKNLIEECRDRYVESLQHEYNRNRPSFVRAWTVVFNHNKLKQTPHIHHYNPLNLSGVYYVSGDFAPGNGELEMYPDPENPKHRINYIPKKGSLVLFPSCLGHSLGIYAGRNPRISVAFDLWFKPYQNGNFIHC